MRRVLIGSAIALSLLAMASCGKPQQHKQQPPADQGETATPETAAPEGTAPATLPASGGAGSEQYHAPTGPVVSGPASAASVHAPKAACNGLPDKTVIAATLHKANIDTYGAETPADFIVDSVTGTDCTHVAVIYHAKGSSGSAQSTTLENDDGKWVLLFYKKQYPLP